MNDSDNREYIDLKKGFLRTLNRGEILLAQSREYTSLDLEPPLHSALT